MRNCLVGVVTLLVSAESRHFASIHGGHLGGVVELAAIGGA